jgi:ribosomal protein L24
MKKGDTVTVLSGPYQGKQGTVENIPRKWVLVRPNSGQVVSLKANEVKVDDLKA